MMGAAGVWAASSRLVGAQADGAVGAAGVGAGVGAVPSLRDAAAAAGLVYGAASDERFRDAPAEYLRLFIRECALFAPNLSWQDLAPDPLHENDQQDANAAVALDAGLKITGAHLLWYLRTPAWLETLPRAQAEQAAAAHIQRLAGFYRGRCFSWNVVNEAIQPPEGAADGLRVKSALVRALGPGFFEAAFREARAADPGAMLLYNDYDLELAAPDQESRRTALFKLLDRLQKAGAPIDGVGLQSHLKWARFGEFDEAVYRRFLHDIAARGLKIVITELDVEDRGAPADADARDREVGKVYERFLRVALDESAVVGLVTWGLCDAYSWYNGKYFPQFVRPDGLPQRPLLFDGEFRAKPAFYAVLRAVEGAPRRASRGRGWGSKVSRSF